MGGSALALRLGHRQSEDLDFVWPGAKLPRDRLEALHRASVVAGMAAVPHDDPTALREFADGGLDLLDFQQDYLMGDGVKVTFFSPEPSLIRRRSVCCVFVRPRWRRRILAARPWLRTRLHAKNWSDSSRNSAIGLNDPKPPAPFETVCAKKVEECPAAEEGYDRARNPALESSRSFWLRGLSRNPGSR
jgi:hypothetical protein